MEEEELKGKKLSDLRLIARGLGIIKSYKSNKSELISRILSTTTKNFTDSPKQVKPIKERRWFYPAIFFLLSIIVTTIYYLSGSENSKDSTQEIITIVTESLKTDEEYSKYIELQEALNIGLLKNFFGNEFQVFGQRDNHMFKNGAILKSKIISTNEELIITISAGDIVFGGIPIRYNNETFTINKSKIGLGKLFIVSGLGINNKTLGMVMLNNDMKNPIYAIGMASYR